MEDQEKLYSVGELARRCGVTVRTLQYYDSQGLLSPSRYTEGGRRLYTRKDIFLLQQILFLKSFGFSLTDIREHLMETGTADKMLALFTRQREVIQQQIRDLEQIDGLLGQAMGEIQVSGEIGTEKLVAIMGLMKLKSPYAFLMRYFRNEDIKSLMQTVDIEDPDLTQNEMPQMFAELISIYNAGADPEGEEGQRLAAQWWGMVQKYSAENPGMMDSMVGMGMDVENWPDEVGEIKTAIRDFMSKAFYKYLSDNQINLGGK